MLLTEVQEVVKGWSEEPPLVFLVEALVHGLGGGTKPKVLEPETLPAPSIDPIPSPGELSDLAFRAGRSLAIVDHDPGLPKSAPIFDLDELRRKNVEKAVSNTRKKALANG